MKYYCNKGGKGKRISEKVYNYSAKKAIKNAGLEVKIHPIRGGTDGARFSFMGLPTPNIFTGGFNYHSKKEFIPIFAMEKAVETILNIIDIATERFLEENSKN